MLAIVSAAPDAPRTEAELLARAERLAGRTLGAIAADLERDVPPDLKRNKGFVGQLFELALGATAGSRARPDFEALGVELKSILVDASGVPLETTFVCTIPLLDIGQVEWQVSRVRCKLTRVLWMPVIGVREIAVADRRVGAPLLWSPSQRDEADMRWDWEELAGMIGRGAVADVTGHFGKVLQVRPKAANSRARRSALDADGTRVQVLPRGFYLRTSFTARLLREHFLLPMRSL
jgi:DNA mismatch repair protein MutH